jgi:glutamate synthase (NADPH/NADH) large chain
VEGRGVDLSKLLYMPDIPADLPRWNSERQDHGLERALDHSLIAAAAPALERGEAVTIDSTVCNVNRSVGAMLSGQLARRYGHAGLPNDTISVTLTGTAGQSFAAFLAHGITLTLVGDGNDYVGKGLSGGRVIVRQPEGIKRDPTANIIVGNTVLYGAISGEAYFSGVAGERFAVRNSGAIAVVEGTGDHACEYMTGGVVVVLGKTGRNFAAGMSGGVAYVYDPQGNFGALCNTAMVDLERFEADDVVLGDDDADVTGNLLRFDAARLRVLIERHHRHTGSARAREILDNWAASLNQFVKVMPKDYRRALTDMEASATPVAAE